MLYDEIGGAAMLRTAVTLFYRRVLADSTLAPWFADVDMTRLRAHQQAFLTAALGGPDLFNGRDMADAHAGRRITGAAFDRLVSHLAEALRDLGAAPAAVAGVGRRLEALRASIVDKHPDAAADDADAAADDDGRGSADPVSQPAGGRSATRPGC